MRNFAKYQIIASLLMTSIILIFSSNVSYSQTNCAFALDEAQNAYEEGVFQKIPDLLLSCMENGFSKDEKLRAYKLLTLTYLFDDKQEKAEKLMLEFLNKYPEYEISPADPVEFKHLYEDYETVPLYSFGFTLGGNLTDAWVTEKYGVADLNKYNPSYKSSGMGFQLGLRVNRYLKEDWEINAEIIYSQNIYQYNSTEYNFISVSKKETFSSLSVPVTMSYDFSLGDFAPYLRSGLSLNYLFQSSALFNRSYSEEIGLTDVTGPELDMTGNRKTFNLSFLLGGGVKYSVSNGYFLLDVRTNLGLLNFVNPKHRYSAESAETIYKYFYIDDDILINKMFFSIGYIRRLYKTYER